MKPEARSNGIAMNNDPGTRCFRAGRPAGFTLVELMVTIVVLAVLAAIALPNFRSLIQRNAVSTQVNGLLAALQYARSEAITTRSFVSLCARKPTANGADNECVPGNRTLDGGWLVYTTTAADRGKVFDASNAGQRLLQTSGMPDNVSMRAGSPRIPTFDARGELNGDWSVRICAKSPSDDEVGENTKSVPGRMVTISASGRAFSSVLPPDDPCEEPMMGI